MRRSLFTTFRGADGRSLAWALALLLLVNAFVSGANIGFAATPGVTLCAVGDTHGAGDTPGAPGHADPCCLAGCVTSAAGVPVAGTILPLPRPTAGTLVVSGDAVVRATLRWVAYAPRGPPLLA
jgi:hypothetical protein